MSEIIGERRALPHKPCAGAALFTFGGMAAAFGLASCCALPLMLAAMGLGTAWLSRIALMAAPHRELLLGAGGLGLVVGATLLWRQQRIAAACIPGAACMPVNARVIVLVGLLFGAALLWAGYRYV